MLRTITISCCALLFALLAPLQSQVLIGALGGVNNMTMSGDANDEDEVINAKVEQVKSAMQHMIDEGLAAREHVFW